MCNTIIKQAGHWLQGNKAATATQRAAAADCSQNKTWSNLFVFLTTKSCSFTIFLNKSAALLWLLYQSSAAQ